MPNKLTHLAVALAVAVVVTGANPSTASPAAPARHLPACVNEDGSGGPTPCVWDGAHRGNGQGTSYVVTSGTETAR